MHSLLLLLLLLLFKTRWPLQEIRRVDRLYTAGKTRWPLQKCCNKDCQFPQEWQVVSIEVNALWCYSSWNVATHRCWEGASARNMQSCGVNESKEVWRGIFVVMVLSKCYQKKTPRPPNPSKSQNLFMSKNCSYISKPSVGFFDDSVVVYTPRTYDLLTSPVRVFILLLLLLLLCVLSVCLLRWHKGSGKRKTWQIFRCLFAWLPNVPAAPSFIF